MNNCLNSLSKVSSLLQFAYCAKKLVFGESVIVNMMLSKVKAMVLATDVSSSQEKKYLAKAEYYKVKVIRIYSKSELGDLFSKNEVACVGLLDHNMAEQIVKLTK